jgi:hypothetical protein
MLGSITLALATPIAKIILDKFYEGVGTKLGKAAVEKLPGSVKEKIQQLGQLVWGRCLAKTKDADKAERLLNAAAAGSEAARANLATGVNQVLEVEPALKSQVEAIATEILQTIVQIDDDSTMTQNNHGGTNYQTKTGPNNTNFFGGEHHHS